MSELHEYREGDVESARNLVFSLCKRDTFRMSIPPHRDDSDMLILRICDKVNDLQSENKALQEKLAVAMEALEFYSDIDKCAVINDIDGRLCLNDKHNGETARQTLKQIKDLK